MAALEWLTYDDFSSRVGEVFAMTMADRTTVTVELAEALKGSALGGPGPDGQERMQFSVVFRGPATPAVPQGTHRLSHAELGELDLFLVPIGPDASGQRYEAAFA